MGPERRVRAVCPPNPDLNWAPWQFSVAKTAEGPVETAIDELNDFGLLNTVVELILEGDGFSGESLEQFYRFPNLAKLTMRGRAWASPVDFKYLANLFA